MEFIVESSKGAYIRTLAHDLGQKMGCGGHLCVLRRTKVGSFNITDSDSLEDLSSYSKSKLKSRLLSVESFVPSHAL